MVNVHVCYNYCHLGCFTAVGPPRLEEYLWVVYLLGTPLRSYGKMEVGHQIATLAYVTILSNQEVNLFSVLTYYYCSQACPINLGRTVILTGGSTYYDYKTTSRVVEYNETGYLRDLPPLQVQRTDHGCGYILSQDGIKVNINNIKVPTIPERTRVPTSPDFYFRPFI